MVGRNILIVAAVAVSWSCVGELEPTNPEDPGSSAGAPDAGPSAPASGADAGGPGQDIACDDPVADVKDGEHNPGQPCLACHTPGGEGPAFTVGGTLYAGLGGGEPVVGATIHMIDANGADVVMVSARNGNFWTKEPVAFPVTTYATACPDVQPMLAPVQESGGDCNVGGCHDADFRIHLP